MKITFYPSDGQSFDIDFQPNVGEFIESDAKTYVVITVRHVCDIDNKIREILIFGKRVF